MSFSFLTRILHSSIWRNRNSSLKLEVLRIAFALKKIQKQSISEIWILQIIISYVYIIHSLRWKSKNLDCVQSMKWSAALPGCGHVYRLVPITVCQVQTRLGSGSVEAVKHYKPWISSFWLPWAVLSEEEMSWANVLAVAEHWICSWGRARPLSEEELLPWWRRPRGTPGMSWDVCGPQVEKTYWINDCMRTNDRVSCSCKEVGYDMDFQVK